MTSVVIAGGGIIGLSVGWRAAQRGLAVTVADPAPGSGASRASAGMLTPAAEAAYSERDLFTLGLASMREWPEFAASLTAASGQPTGLRHEGTLQVAYDSGDAAVLAEHQVLRESFGVPGEWLTGRQARELEPLLAPGVHAGMLTPGDGSVDPRLVTSALLTALERAGGRLVRQPVTEILTHDGAVTGARLGDGTELGCDWLVLACGAAGHAIAGLPAAAIPPVRPVKGQVLRLRATPAAGLPRRTVSGIVAGSGVYLVPRDSGELVVGATQEEVGPDTRVTAGGVWQLLRDARKLLPALTEMEFTEACAGLRPGTPDNAPVIGPAGPAGLVVAAGHFRTGVLLTPATAGLVTEYLVTGRLPDEAGPFQPGRFAGHDAAALTAGGAG